MNIIEERNNRTKWFLKDRFGMFIHWGIYSIPARGEWVMTNERMTLDEYSKYFYEFDPVDYNPKEWAKLAKEAGMKYAVMTAKHHDGFCLFDSAYTKYKSTNTKANRDLINEYVEAFRNEEIKIGLYYSVIDWSHSDFPHYEDKHHPMRDNPEYKDYAYDFDNYLNYMHKQVEELCTNYGEINILWFDFSYDDMVGEKWKATELIKMVRKYQPNVIIDNRLEASGENSGSIMSDNPSAFAGDFASPEQIIPPHGIVDVNNNPVPWEACITMNNNWGYAASDKNFKSPKLLIRKLVETVSKNGNLILNIGPDAKGNIPIESVNILKDIGKWMKYNGDSIYNCGKSNLEKPEWGYFTQNNNSIYAHIFEPSIGPLAIKGLNNSIKSARLLSDYSEIEIIEPWNTMDYNDDYIFINFGKEGQLTYPIPNEIDTVVEFILKEDK